MPRYTIPVLLTVTATDAHTAAARVTQRTLSQLDVPGLVDVRIGVPTRVSRRAQRSVLTLPQIADFFRRARRAQRALRIWEQTGTLSPEHVRVLATLFQEGQLLISSLVQTVAFLQHPTSRPRKRSSH